MPFNRSDTYANRIKSASKIGTLFSHRHMETLPLPWRMVMRGLGWFVVLIVIAMLLFPTVMIMIWLIGVVF